MDVPQLLCMRLSRASACLTQTGDGTNAVRDALVEACDPVIGLTIVNQALDTFLKRVSRDSTVDISARTGAYCFCLVAMAKFILVLPAEVVEDELPRVQGSLIKVSRRVR